VRELENGFYWINMLPHCPKDSWRVGEYRRRINNNGSWSLCGSVVNIPHTNEITVGVRVENMNNNVLIQLSRLIIDIKTTHPDMCIDEIRLGKEKFQKFSEEIENITAVGLRNVIGDITYQGVPVRPDKELGTLVTWIGMHLRVV